MPVVALLILHPLFVLSMRGVVSFLFRQCLTPQLPNDFPILSTAFRANSGSLRSSKQLPAVALEQGVCRHPREDLTQFHILSFVVPSSAFDNLQSSHPFPLGLGMMAMTPAEVKHRNRIGIGYEIHSNR